MFIFNNEKGRGFVHNILNHKTYSVGDFVDMVFHEKMKDKLKENLKGGK